ncbi:unnamed protein product [Ectocarpus sp. 12 AP-2014]
MVVDRVIKEVVPGKTVMQLVAIALAKRSQNRQPSGSAMILCSTGERDDGAAMPPDRIESHPCFSEAGHPYCRPTPAPPRTLTSRLIRKFSCILSRYKTNVFSQVVRLARLMLTEKTQTLLREEGE